MRFPDGEYTITVAANDRLCRLVQAPPLPAGTAHPVWAHLATHIGKGLTFTEFAEVVGAPVDAGYLFGGGSLEFWEPIRLDTRYLRLRRHRLGGLSRGAANRAVRRDHHRARPGRR